MIVATDEALEAYDLYLAELRAESDREFAAGGHDYTDPDKFFWDGDVDTQQEFVERWLDDEEERAVYRHAEERANGEHI